MHTGGASIFHVPLISSARNLANDLSPCHALVTKSINGTVKFPPAFSDGTAVPAYVLGLSRLKIDLTKFDLRPEKGLMRASHQPWSKYPVNRILLSRLPAVLLNSLPPGENRVRAARYSR